MRIIGNHITFVIFEEGIYKNSQYLIIFYNYFGELLRHLQRFIFTRVFLKIHDQTLSLPQPSRFHDQMRGVTGLYLAF